VIEFDIGEFFIWGEAKEVDGEFQAVIVMRAKEAKNAISYHQVEKDRWFKTADVAATAAKEAAKALKEAVDAGALSI
jgi:LmbE family N-acetylglucosaminyl deacetylase